MQHATISDWNASTTHDIDSRVRQIPADICTDKKHLASRPRMFRRFDTEHWRMAEPLHRPHNQLKLYTVSVTD